MTIMIYNDDDNIKNDNDNKNQFGLSLSNHKSDD